MSIPTTIESLSTTAASNGPSGSDQRTTADDGLRQAYAFIRQLKNLATLASGTTVTPPSTSNVFSVTGVTAIATIASTNSWDGRDILFVFAGIMVLTNGSNLILPGSANITTAVGDAAWFVQIASGQWRCVNYTRADGSWSFGNLTADAFIPSGSTVPANGLYLKAANNPALSSNSTLRWDVNSTGNHTFAAPTSGACAVFNGIAAGVMARFVGLNSTESSNFDIGTDIGDTPNTAYMAMNWTTGTAFWDFRIGGITSASNWMRVSENRNITIPAPAAGATVAVTSVSTNPGIQIFAADEAGNPAFGTYNLNASSTLQAFLANNLVNIDFGNARNGALNFFTNSTSKLSITSDGRLYGSALHNNAGAVTGTTNQYVASGTYTPTLTNTTNVANSSFTDSATTKWIRVGNVVHVSGGNLNIQPTAASGTQTVLDISLPIASTLGLSSACSGVASDAGGPNAGTANTGASIQGSVANNRAQLVFEAGNTNSQPWAFSFTYTVL